MAFAFKTPPAKPAFGEFREPLYAGEYIQQKKTKATFCRPTKCPGGPVVASQGDYLLLNNAKNIVYDSLHLPFNKTDLTINLITTLDLSGCCTVESNPATPATPSCSINIPAQGSSSVPFYVNYTIDPSGCLFGETLCGANNYLRRLVYSTPSSIDINSSNNSEFYSDKIIFGDE